MCCQVDLSSYGTTPEKIAQTREIKLRANETGKTQGKKEKIFSVKADVSSEKLETSKSTSQPVFAPISVSPSSNLFPSTKKDTPSTFAMKEPQPESKPDFIETKSKEKELNKNNSFQTFNLSTPSAKDTAVMETAKSPVVFPPASTSLGTGVLGSSKPCVEGKSPREILINFYQERNPLKVGEVDKLLAKYDGQEETLFRNLAKKYNLDPSVFGINDAATLSQPSPAPIPSSFFSGPSSTTSTPLFGAGINTPKSGTPSFGGFGTMETVASPKFGSSATPAPSSFQSAFGGGAKPASSPSPFSASPSPSFGSVSNAKPTFGSRSSPSPFSVSGQSARDMLIAFYQKHNPSKIAEVDKVLTKYKGQEEQLFRNLAKKYNLDPSTFGISGTPTTAPGFGSSASGVTSVGFGQTNAGGFGKGVSASPSPFSIPSNLGTSSTSGGFASFGKTSGIGSGAPAFGSTMGATSTFGSASSPNAVFGSLASGSGGTGGITSFGGTSGFGSGFGGNAPAPSGFGSGMNIGFGGGSGGGFGTGTGGFNPSPFGSPTPSAFGAPRR